MATRPDDPSDEWTARTGPPTESARLGGDREIRYTEYGRSDGVPVVFLHGTPGSRRLARLFDDAAADAGVRLLAIDRPGFGGSDPWPDRSVSDAGRFVTAVLDDADVDAAGLIAFSGGAPFALATAATHPDRVTSVDLVAGATPPDEGSEPPAVQRLLAGLATTTPTLLRGLFRGQRWLAARFDPSFVLAQYTTDGADEVDDDAAEIVKRDFVEAFNHHRSGVVTEFRHTSSAWGIDYDAIDAPVTLWHGDDDTNVPIDGARRLARTIPDAELHVLDGADHLRTLLRATPTALDARR